MPAEMHSIWTIHVLTEVVIKGRVVFMFLWSVKKRGILCYVLLLFAAPFAFAYRSSLRANNARSLAAYGSSTNEVALEPTSVQQKLCERITSKARLALLASSVMLVKQADAKVRNACYPEKRSEVK